MNRFARGMLIAVLCVGLVGFGLCGALGTVAGLGSHKGSDREAAGIASLMLQCGLAGLAIASGCGYGLYRLMRRRRPDA